MSSLAELIRLICTVFVSVVVVPVIAQLTVEPESVVQVEGLEAVFECLYPGAIVHSWRINGTLPDDDQFPSELTRIPPSVDSPIAMLIIPATLQYNKFVVQCEAIVRVGEELVTRQSPSATLEVQNTGTPVLRTQNTEGTQTVTISWENPFTTNIIFCVRARSVESNEMIRSVCGVSGTEYNFTSLESGLCEDISFTVTPTGGGRSGTSKTVVGYIPGTRDVLRTSAPCNGTRILETRCELLFTTPLSCGIELTFTSNDAEELPQISHTVTISGNGGTTYPLDSTIAVNRHYSVGVTVITSSGRHALPSQLVSTHDIIEGRAEPSITEGALRTTCTFVQDTMASGYLVTIYRDFCNIHDDIVFSVEYNTAGTGDTISGVGSGQYTTAFFDLENDGLPIHSRDNHTLIASASLADVHITTGTRSRNNIESANPLEKATIELDGDTVCVYCSSNVDCLVLLYDCTTPDILITLFVPVNEERCSDIQDGHYSVAFYGINSSSAFLLEGFPGRVFQDFNLVVPTTNSVTTVIGSLVSVVLAVLCGVLGVLLLMYWCKRRRISNSKVSHVKDPTKKYSAHRSVVLSKEWGAFKKNTGASGNSKHEFDTCDHNPAYAVPNMVRVKDTADKEVVDTTITHISPYAEISGHLHEGSRQVYAHVTITTPHQPLPGDLAGFPVEYAVLDQKKLVVEQEEKADTAPAPTLSPKLTPHDASTLHALLTPAASKWYELGRAMGLSENTLEDEISLSNSTDWLRLGKICTLYCQCRPDWEEVVCVLWEAEEWEIADQIYHDQKELKDGLCTFTATTVNEDQFLQYSPNSLTSQETLN